MPPHKNQVNFDPHTWAKYFSTPTQKARQFRSLLWSQVNSDPYTEIKSISTTHINQVNFDTNTKTKSFSTPTQIPS